MKLLTTLITVLALILATLSANALSQSASDEAVWRFQVFIDDRDVGTHNFMVTTMENARKVTSEADFNVKVFVNVFSYKHRNQETWQANCLANIESATRMNREKYAVSGQLENNTFVLADQADADLPDCVQTFAYWNPTILQASQLLNAQTGILEEVDIQPVGSETFAVNGVDLSASKYRINLETGYIDVWYDEQTDTWLGLETLTAEGNLVRYVPIQTPLQQGSTT